MIREHFNRYIWYYIIAAVSLVLLFLPFLGSASLGLALPTTSAGWLVFVGTKLIVAAVNVIIFHSFTQQAPINVKDDPHYKEAKEILNKYRIKPKKLESLEEHYRSIYKKKGILTFITSLASAFVLGQAILTFNAALFLSYLLTLVLGIISGIIHMKSEEGWLCNDWWEYAKEIEKQKKEELELENQEL